MEHVGIQDYFIEAPWRVLRFWMYVEEVRREGRSAILRRAAAGFCNADSGT